MPRYFFHLLQSDEDAVKDDEGMEFDDNAAARREGIASLADLISDVLKANPAPMDVSVQIVREGHGITDVLTASIGAQLTLGA